MREVRSESPTLAGVLCTGASPCPSGPQPLPRRTGVNVFRASFAQERVWFLEQIAGGSGAYNVAGAFEARGRVDVSALRVGLATVIGRHETLRTTFVAIEGVPMQVVSPIAPIGLAIRSLPAASDAIVREEIRREVERPFDLARGPLVRLRVLAIHPMRHVLILTMHHLVADAWSVGLLAREVSAVYAAVGRGELPNTTPPELQYADYSEWQRRKAEAYEDADDLRRYWRTQLGGAPYPRGPRDYRPSFRGAAEVCALDPQVVRALRAAARRAGVTPFAVALAAWQVVLGRWTGLEDVTVLVPVANRERSELAEVVGFFVNLIALRTRLEGDPSVVEVFRRVGEVVRQGIRHQGLPFEVVLSALQVDRTLARPPLSPFAFAFEQLIDTVIELPGVTLSALPIETHAARIDLALIVSEDVAGTTARLEYDRALYDPGEVARLLRDFEACLRIMVVEDETRPISSLLPNDGEVAAVESPHSTVWEAFQAQVRRSPSAIAVRAGASAITYERLSRDAQRVASLLRDLGVGADVVVAVRAERGIRWITGMLGIWGAGGVYFPLDSRWPRARTREVLEQSGACAVLVDAEPSSELLQWAGEGTGRRIVRLDVAMSAARTPGRGPNAGDVAYLLYTSGSTGLPKGALIEHAGLLNHLAAKVDLLGLQGGDRVAQTAAVSFDVSVWQCVAPLMVGAEVVVLDDATATIPWDLSGAVAREHVTVVELVPSLLQALLDGTTAEEGAGFRNLRWLVVTGEALAPELCRRWLARYPDIPLVNAYGPTECADDVTHHVVRTPPPIDAIRIPIGRPIPGMHIDVVDEGLAPVASGVVGELCVIGVGVGRGYLGDPERTAASFVMLPGSDGSPGRRAYRTGDLGRRLCDGTFEWLGRVDAQVKLRGVRIEPEEIEAVLKMHAAVGDAAVLPEPPESPQRLVAYVQTERNDPDVVEELHAWIAERVPEPMVPSRFELRICLPRTPNGKLDRRALARSPENPVSFVAVDVRRPESATEHLLAKLWREVLGVDVPSVTVGFFALGGDSLATIRLVATARRYGLVFTPHDVFAHQTIAELAAVAKTTSVPPAEQGLVVGDFEPTPIQRLLFAAGLPRLDHYNMSALLAVERRIDPAALAIAVEHLLRHHDVLRLRAVREEQGWRTTLGGIDGVVPYSHVDLGTLDDCAAAAAVESTAAAVQASLDLASGPIARVVSFDLGPARASRLLLVVHHLACDAASWPILLEDLAAVYDQVEQGEPIALPAKTSSYRAWADRLARYASTDDGLASAAWDDASVTGSARLPRKTLEAKLPRVADVASFVSELDAETSTRLLATTARLGVTMESVIVTALAVVLTRDGGEDRLFVYLERHGREPIGGDIDVSRTVGWFTAVFPVCVRLAPSRRPHDTLLEVDRRLRTIPQGGIGWALQRESLSIEDDRSVAKRPELSCNYLGRVDPPAGFSWTIAPESAGPEVGPGGTRPTSLDVVGSVADGRLRIAWHYDTVAHDAATIEGLAAQCLELVRALEIDAAAEEGRRS